MKIKLPKLFTRQDGQSLLEIAVSLGLVALIITILTVTTLNGLRNSQFAKNQVLASSYAQQGIELVKAIRQKDCPITVNGTIDTFKWYAVGPNQALIWTTTNDAFNSNSQNPVYFVAAVNSSTCTLVQNNLGEPLENNVFTRRIRLERAQESNGTLTTGILRVSVIVSWTDFTGQHESNNVSLLTNYE